MVPSISNLSNGGLLSVYLDSTHSAMMNDVPD